MATNQQGDLRLVLAGFFQSVDLVSSFPGKLRIVHLCASLTWWLEKHAYAIAACSLTTNIKVALQVESTKRRLALGRNLSRHLSQVSNADQIVGGGSELEDPT